LEDTENLVVEKTLQLKKEKDVQITTTYKKQKPRGKKGSDTISKATSKISAATI